MMKYEEEVSHNPFTIQDESVGCWKRLTVYLCNKAQKIGTNITDDSMSWGQGVNDGNISMDHWRISQFHPHTQDHVVLKYNHLSC